MDKRNLQIDGTYNIRDLGGYPIGDHVTTKSHMLIRAGNLDQLPMSSQQQLIDYGVKTVIDLRDEWEVENYPNVFAQSTVVKYLNLPLIGNHLSNDETWKEEERDYRFLHDFYIKYIEHCQSQISTIMKAIAENPTTIIFHCYAGKDRTGIIAGLLLDLAGVPRQIIAEDYAKSNQEIQHLIKQWRSYTEQNNGDMQALERDSASEPITILNMLDYIDRQYGGIRDYLMRCGLTDSQLRQIRSHLIESNG